MVEDRLAPQVLVAQPDLVERSGPEAAEPDTVFTKFFSLAKAQIRQAFKAIAKHFQNALTITQGAAQVIEGGGTALVIMETLLHIGNAERTIKRRATYVFRNDPAHGWQCAVDNYYGTGLLDAPERRSSLCAN